MSTTREVLKTKASSFNLEWGKDYLCRDHGGESQCLVCKKHVVSKVFNIKRHYDALHSAEYEKYKGEERNATYLNLISGLEYYPENVRILVCHRLKNFTPVEFLKMYSKVGSAMEIRYAPVMKYLWN